MKKILLAAAATSMVAGPVAAQGIDFSGYARFGLVYVENTTGGFNNEEVDLTGRFRLTADVSADTDFGARLSARFRAQGDQGRFTPGSDMAPPTQPSETLSFSSPRFAVSGGGLTVATGNIFGAIESLPGHYFGSRSAGLGLTGLGYVNMAGNARGASFAWDAFSSNAAGPAQRNGVEVIYSAAGFTGHISYTEALSQPGGVGNPVLSTERVAGFVAYTFGEYTAALGFQNSDVAAEDKVIGTFTANFDQFRVNVQAADNRGVKKVVLNGDFAVTPEATIFGFVSNESGNPSGSVHNGTGGGVGLRYLLGGGASIETGVTRSSNSIVRADFGMFFSF